MLALTGSSAMWYLSRGSGIVSLLLLTASVVLGVVTTVRWRAPRWPRFVTSALHRNVSLVVVVFLGIHIATAILDAYAPIGWLDAVVPLRSGYRPLWLGLGALSVDLLLAVTITSLLRPRIDYRLWRFVHWASYACWPVALLHGLGTGTDTRLGWVLFLNLACLLSVMVAVWWRVAVTATRQPGPRLAAVAASIVVPALIVVWLVAEPLQPGWARKAGTPAPLLGAPAAAAAAIPSASPDPAGTGAFTSPFTASFSGTATTPDGGASVVVDGALSDGAAGRVHLDLETESTDRGRLQLTGGTATLGTDSQPAMFRGTVSSAGRRALRLSLQGPGGRTLELDVRMRMDMQSGTANGIIESVDPAQGGGTGG